MTGRFGSSRSRASFSMRRSGRLIAPGRCSSSYSSRGSTSTSCAPASTSAVTSLERWISPGMPNGHDTRPKNVDTRGMTQRLLVVDDDRSIRETMELALTEEGYIVDTANDAEEAMDAIRANAPDLLILDVMLP